MGCRTRRERETVIVRIRKDQFEKIRLLDEGDLEENLNLLLDFLLLRSLQELNQEVQNMKDP